MQGDAPRWSIPIDVSGDQHQDGYAFLDAANCGATVGTNDDQGDYHVYDFQFG
jgi:hypothetical protein